MSTPTPETNLQLIEDLRFDADQIWVLLAGFLVFWMHAGFAMLEAGSVRQKNTINILFKNIGTVCIGAITYFTVGFAFAYGTQRGKNKFIGTGDYGLSESQNGNKHNWFFQYAFAATASTILSGAIAGRAKLEAYFCACAIITAFIYPVVSHWVWAPEGWLSAFADPEDRIGYKTDEKTCGFIDYAGSAVVHMTGGIIGLIGAIFVGPRIGKFENPDAFKGHNYALIAIGVLILWFGWFGFNCGSTLAFDGNVASKVAVTTVLSPASACITGIVIQRAMGKYWDVANALNTVLAGLVSITAGCSVVADWHAIFIGMIGAMVYMSVSKTMIYFRVDDPVDAIAVHGGLCGNIFAEANEIKNAYDCPNAEGNGTGLQFGIQLAGILAIIGFVGACSIVMFLFIKLTIGLRVGAEEEELGLDESEHGHKAYSQGAFNQDRDTEKGKEIGKHGSNVELKQTSTVNLTKAAV